MPASRPTAAPPDQFRCALDLTLVRIALFNHGDGKAVRTENEIDIGRIGESGQRAVDGLDDGIDVCRVLVELLYHVDPGTPAVGVEMARPLVEAAAGRGLGVLRVEGQQDELGRGMPLHFLDCGVGERMPVAHRDGHASIVVAAQDPFERDGLAIREFQNRALAADFAVMMSDMFRAARSDQARERLPGDAREREVDNIRIAEKVVQEGLDRLDGIRPPQLK